MRAELKELCTKLGVGYVLSPYETCPWSVYDADNGVTVSAEVRMSNEGNEIEAEMQYMYDTPEEGKSPIEQVFYLFAKPVAQDKWSPTALKIRGQDEEGALYEWETKGCNFFAACVQELKMGNIPDLDEIYDREMDGKERFRDGRQGGGSKAPKIKPQALLGMKGGRGF